MYLEARIKPTADFYESCSVSSFPFEWSSVKDLPLLRHLSKLLLTAEVKFFLFVTRAETALDRESRWLSPEQQRLEYLVELSL